MKKNMIIAAAVLASAVACTKEIEEPSALDGKVQMSFAVSTEQTKTVLEGTNKTLWTGVEKLSIFDGESNNLFSAELSSPAATAQFTGKAKETSTYYALYPYNSAAKLAGTTVSTELPAAQTATKGTFDPSAALLFGTADGTSVTLKNLTAMLKLTVPANVTSIEVDGNGTALAGSVNVNVESAELSGATATKVTLAGKGALEAGTYYIAVAPTTVSGLSVKLIDSANSKYILRTVEASRTLAANTIYDMGDFSSLAWTSEGGDEPSENDLVIFDNAFKSGFSIDDKNTMSIESVDGQDCLKWVFGSNDAWHNYGAIAINPALDFANFDADKTVLKFKFKVGVDHGPSDVHRLFSIFLEIPGIDIEIGKGVGRDGGLDFSDIVVKDNEWHELTLPLKDYVARMTGANAAIKLGFSPLGYAAAVGTTIYFKDIRISGNSSSEPEQPKPTEDAQIIFDEAMQNGWIIGGTDGKYSIKDGVGKDGGKGIEWVLDDTGSWARALEFKLPTNTDISEYTKFCFDIRYVNSTFASGNAAFQNRMFGDGIELYYTMYAPNDDQWNTVEMALSDFQFNKDVSGTKDWTKFKNFCFHTMGWYAGTATVYIDNVRLVKVGDSGSSEPEQPKPTEDAQIIFDEAMQNSWELGGTIIKDKTGVEIERKYKIADGVGKDGGKGIEWVLDDTGSWARALEFKLPTNTDISEYTKFCFDIRYVNSTFASGNAAFQNRMFGDGIELYYTMYAPNDDQWNTVEMSLTDFQFNEGVSGTKDWTKFKNFCFHTMGWYAGTATVYIDNVRLVK